MKEPIIKSKERKRGKRGGGRLYLRNSNGKEYKAGTKGVQGAYWLEYWRPTGKKDPETGKPIKQRERNKLTYREDDGTRGICKGDPITTLADAKEDQIRIIAQYVTGTTKDRLQKIKAELAAVEQEHDQAIESATPPLTIADAWDAYENSPESLDSGADLLRRYCGYWNSFTKWALQRDPAIKYVRDIPAKMATDYASHLLRKKISPNTYNKHTCFLKLFFNTLIDAEFIETNPFAKIRSKKLRTESRRELTREELYAVLGNAEGDLQTVFFIGTYTGLRMGDCCTLKWGEVDLDKRIIRRVPNKTKGDHPDPVKIGIPGVLYQRLLETPKNKRKGYVLPKYAELYSYCNEAGEATRRASIFRTTQKHFEAQGIQTHKKGTGYQLKPDPNKPGKYIRIPTGKRAVVEVGFHSLRHTFVSLQAERGTPASTVQAIVGHGSPAMTQHYHHTTDEAAWQAAHALDSGIMDADFEVLPDPLPDWAREKLETMTAQNWDKVLAEVLADG